MNQPNLPPDDTTQSFVLRLWQTTSGQWRGSVRHVQSDTRQAFSTLDQAVRWIERYLADRQAAQQTPAGPYQPRFLVGIQRWWAVQPRLVTTGLVLAGGVALLALVVTLAPAAPASLAGAAIENSGSSNRLGPFIFGLVVGGGLVALWGRLTIKR